MRAVILGDTGVKITEIEKPSPQPHQALIRVRACGLNRSDLLETQGQSFGHTGGDAKVLGGDFARSITDYA